MIDVLVVDDDFMVARIHERFVQQTDGFRMVGSVRTGEDALAAVADLGPDLLLLDVHLPDIDGLEVLRRLRADGHDVGVIMITAAREADTVRGALHGGAVGYLIKPFGYEDLARRLEDFRHRLAVLAEDEPAGQADVDQVFGAGSPAPRPAAEVLPKGLSGTTGEAVLAALQRGGELSAAECAEEVGLSRVTARRYLEHYVDTGRAGVRLRYGKAGRPERRYRPA